MNINESKISLNEKLNNLNFFILQFTPTQKIKKSIYALNGQV